MKNLLITVWIIVSVFLLSSVGFRNALAEPMGTNIEVSTPTDEYGVDNGLCSLREAIVASNTDAAFGGCPAGSGRDTIYVPADTYYLTLSGSDNISEVGDLDIFDDVEIYGDGVNATFINGSDIDRIFDIQFIDTFPPTEIDVEIWGLTVENGQVLGSGSGGGGILIIGESNSLNLHDCTVRNNQIPNGIGGGVASSRATLLVTNCTIRDNFANNGGGIYTDGAADIYQSLISENFGDNDGGGIDSGKGDPDDPGVLTLIDVTISGNTSDTGSAIFTDSVVNITNSTIVVNSGSGDGVANNGTINVKNTIIAFNGALGAENCGGTGGIINSNGYNMENVESCGFSSIGDQPNTNPDLDVDGLQDNGGPTKTYALQYGSPAIDSADNVDCPPVDQRGFTRPVDGDQDHVAICDIGAYEANALVFLYFPSMFK